MLNDNLYHKFNTFRRAFNKLNPVLTGISLLLSLSLIFGSSSLTYSAGVNSSSIRILEKVEIEGDSIFLGEVAVIKSRNSVTTEKLKKVVLGKSPLPGKSRQIGIDLIKICLKKNRMDLSQLTFRGSEKTEVSRSFIRIPKEKIEKAVVDFLYRRIPWKKHNVEIKSIKVSQEVILPKGNITYKVQPPKHINFLGTIPLSIIFKVDGKFQKKVWSTINIAVLTDVVVSQRPIRRFQTITEGDIHLKKMNLANLPSGIITNIHEALGKRAKRAINVKAVLRADFIELPPLVRRGDVVTVIAESAGLKISAVGKVREKGHRGDRIRVMNLDSGKAIYARVLNSNTVLVDF
jgi:flagella basal body P-ring formation protein FlgA